MNELKEGLFLNYEEIILDVNLSCIKIKNNIEEDIKNLSKMINTELSIDEQFNIFESRNFENEIEMENNIVYFKELFLNNIFSVSNPYFNEMRLLENKYNNNFAEETKKIIFGKYYNNHEFLNSIKVFLECNMNTTKASELLYLHRNTLLNRLDKFSLYTGYDIRNFKEACFLYQMLK